jgi:hypothetical protein
MMEILQRAAIYGLDRGWPSYQKGNEMTLQLKIELESQQAAESVLQALEAYKEHLRQNIARTERHLQAFEERYGVSTSVFITEMTAEDLVGGDLDYIEWSGEFELLKGLQQELQELDRARYQLQ